MGGAWRLEENESLGRNLVGYVEIVLDGPMTKEEVSAFRRELNQLVQKWRGRPKRKLKLKKDARL